MNISIPNSYITQQKTNTRINTSSIYLKPIFVFDKKIKELIYNKCNEQQKMMFFEVESNLIQEINRRDIDVEKFKQRINVVIDESEAILITIDSEKTRFYISIEKNINESFFGFINNAKDGEMVNKTSSINLETISKIIKENLQI